MSAPADREQLTPGDWARYAGLLALGTLVFLVVYGNRDGSFVSLLALYLVLASSGLLVFSHRGRRS
ncbi:MAG: hypothetical protein ACR2K2_04275 [Mycobacteriales bacterium]